MTAFEYNDGIIVVDCGLSFPDDEMLGIDCVIPDITFLLENKDKVKGFVITTWSRGPHWCSAICFKRD